MKYLIGIDIGGTKVAYEVFDEKLHHIHSKVFETKAIGGGSLALIDTLLSHIQKEPFNKNDITRIGISINAAVAKNSILKSSVLGVEHFDLVSYIQKKIKVPVSIENDVVSATKAELKLGHGKQYRRFALLNIGTGTRICYCQDGTIIQGYNNVAGEISQTKIFAPEFKKYILLDNFISGNGIAAIYKKLTNSTKSAKEILQEKNEYSIKTVEMFTKSLAYLFELIAYFYNPEVVVVTGSVFQSSSLFLKQALKRFYANNLEFFHFRVYPSKIKHANVLGALLK